MRQVPSALVVHKNATAISSAAVLTSGVLPLLMSNIPYLLAGARPSDSSTKSQLSNTLVAATSAHRAVETIVANTINRKHGRSTTAAVFLKVHTACKIPPYRM